MSGTDKCINQYFRLKQVFVILTEVNKSDFI